MPSSLHDFVVEEAQLHAPPPPPPPPAQTTVIGATIGGPSDRASLCAVRYNARTVLPGDPLAGEPPVYETHYAVLNATYMAEDASHAAIAHQIASAARRLYNRDSRGDYHVLIDTAEVGRPVVDFIRNTILPQVCVTAVTVKPTDTSDSSLIWRTEATIGLKYLVSRLIAIVGAGRLHIPTDLPELLDALRHYDSDVADKPDLVRAMALACVCEFIPVRYDIPPDSLPSAAL